MYPKIKNTNKINGENHFLIIKKAEWSLVGNDFSYLIGYSGIIWKIVFYESENMDDVCGRIEQFMDKRLLSEKCCRIRKFRPNTDST